MRVLGDKFGSCKLCGAETKLCKSHIVPEFCYSYESSGQSRHALQVAVPASGGGVKKEKVQKGYREYLLCTGCEDALCQHERKFAPWWREKVLLVAPFRPGQHLEIPGADYCSIKLFLLSVFWRASVSQFFGQAMDLGPYQDKLRRVLLTNDEVPQEHYPFLGVIVVDSAGQPFNGFVSQPITRRFRPAYGYSMHFGGCEWTLIMSDHYLPSDFKPLQHVIRQNGAVTLIVKHFSECPFLANVSEALRKHDA